MTNEMSAKAAHKFITNLDYVFLRLWFNQCSTYVSKNIERI